MIPIISCFINYINTANEPSISGCSDVSNYHIGYIYDQFTIWHKQNNPNVPIPSKHIFRFLLDSHYSCSQYSHAKYS